MLAKSPPIDKQTFSSDIMSDIFDLIASLDGNDKNYIDLEMLKEFAKMSGVEYDNKNENDELKSMFELIKQIPSGKISKPEFIKLRNLLE